MSDRGWGNSCGGTDPKRTQPVCQNGYNHLMDTRFEVRDAQEIFEALADRAATGATAGEGLIDPQAIGVTGGSYGGGLSMALAALKNRKMIPANDGTLIPWVSDGGKAMRIAAAQPDIPWTDLAYSLQPNGHTLDYVVDSPYMKRGRIGVMKQSFVSGLYATGQATSNYAPAGTDPDADLITWFSSINAGEPYDQNPTSQDIVDEITKHHSSYYINHSIAPAPLLISNGWTDDLFPADEAIRFYNRTRAEYSGTPISLIFTDHGHQRGQNKVPDATFRSRQLHNWFDFYVKGQGPAPFLGVQTLTQTCGTPSGGATGAFDDPNTDQPFRAARWADIAPGEVRFTDGAAKVIAPSVSDQAGQAFDPISGGGACATAPTGDQAGTASYRLEAAYGGGFTLMGSPTIVADINSPGATSQVAARLLDVGTTGTETLVARGLYRPEINSGTAATRQVFQLHPNGWKFADGHIAKLELLPGGPAVWPQLERPGAGDRVQPRAASAGARAAGSTRRARAGPGSEGRAEWLPAHSRLHRRLRAAQGRDAVLHAAGPGLRGLHGFAGPDARRSAVVPILLDAGSDLPEPDRRHPRRERQGRELGRERVVQIGGRQSEQRHRRRRCAAQGLAHRRPPGGARAGRLRGRAARGVDAPHHRPRERLAGTSRPRSRTFRTE